MRKDNNKPKRIWIPWEEVKAELLNTPRKRAEYEAFYREVSMEREKELLREAGERLRKARLRKKLTQEKLAKLINTDRTAITRVEKGEQNISIGYLNRISTALDMKCQVRLVSNKREALAKE